LKLEGWVFSEAVRGCTQRLQGWLALLLVLAASAAPGAANEGLRLAQAEFVLSDSAEPPPDSAPWQPQLLPDSWPTSRRGVSGYAWYRLRFDLASLPREPQAIFIPRLLSVGAVFLNDTLLGTSGRFEVVSPGVRPQMFAFDPELLRSRPNTVHIRLWVGAGWRGAVSTVRLGDHWVMAAALDRERFLRTTTVQMAILFYATIGLITLLIWLGRRHETMYGYFAMTAIASALYFNWYIGQWSPIPVDYLNIFGAPFLATVQPALLFAYGLRFAGWRWPRVERGVWAYTGLLVLAYYANRLLLGDRWFDLLAGLLVFSYCATFALMVYIAWRLRSTDSVMLAIGHLYSGVALMEYGFARPMEGFELGPSHFVPLFLVMGWVLTRRFVRSLNEAERLNAELEQRVEEKHAELERTYAKTQQLTREAAVVEERARIMSDMHDGIGAQLISTLSLVEQGDASPQQVATALRECIADLRLTIDSLEPTDNDLLPALGNLRYRLDGQLKKLGVTLDWQVRELPALACLTPHNLLHVLRILQEAFTNILKHAQADTIRVETGVDAAHGHVFIRVRDNGKGFTAGSPQHGHGLANMAQRAKTVGGELRILPSAAGTTLDLLLPLG
jgi:signal transduction histidine kinase